LSTINNTLSFQKIASLQRVMEQAISTSELRKNRIALAFFFFLSGLRFASWASRIPDIQAQLHLSDAELGSVLFALPAGSISGLPISGNLVARFGSKKILLISAILFPISMIGLGLANNGIALAIQLYIFGITGNLMNIAVNTQAVALEALYARSIMASFHGLWSLGGFSGAFIGTIMVSAHVNHLQHFIWISVVGLILAFFIHPFTLRKESKPQKRGSFFVKPDLYLLTIGFIAFGSMVCEGTMFDWSGVYFVKVLKASTHLRTLGYISFMSAMATGRFIGDKLITQFGPKKVLQSSGVVIASGLLLAVVFPYLVTATMGFLLVGFGVSSIVPLCYAMAGKSKKKAPSLAIASVSSIGFIGFLMGPPLIGYIAQAVSLRLSFTVIACFGASIYFMAPRLKEQ
jgi:MFS family permease